MEVLFNEYINSISALLGNKVGYLSYAGAFGRFVQEKKLKFCDETIDEFVRDLYKSNDLSKVREYNVVLRKIAFKMKKEGFSSIKEYEPIFHRLINLYAIHLEKEVNTIININSNSLNKEHQAEERTKPIITQKTARTYLNALKSYETFLYEHNLFISKQTFEQFIQYILDKNTKEWAKVNIFGMRKFVRWIKNNYSKLHFCQSLLPISVLNDIESIEA